MRKILTGLLGFFLVQGPMKASESAYRNLEETRSRWVKVMEEDRPEARRMGVEESSEALIRKVRSGGFDLLALKFSHAYNHCVALTSGDIERAKSDLAHAQNIIIPSDELTSYEKDFVKMIEQIISERLADAQKKIAARESPPPVQLVPPSPKPQRLPPTHGEINRRHAMAMQNEQNARRRASALYQQDSDWMLRQSIDELTEELRKQRRRQEIDRIFSR
jgi:hypothetical protein